MKLLLHIGMAHCGGARLADWAHLNADGLRAEGVWTALSTHPPYQLGLLAMARLPGRGGLVKHALRLRDAAAHEAFNVKQAETLKAEIAQAKQAGCHTFLLICPDLHGGPDRFRSPAQLAPVLTPLFDQITLVCFVRPHLDAALRAAALAPAAGIPVTKARFENMHPQNAAWDYPRYLEAWAAAFDREQLKVVPFARADPLDWMRDRLGLIRIDQRAVVAATGPDFLIHALLHQTDLPRHADRSHGGRAQISLLPLDAIPFKTGLTLSRQDAQKWQARFSDQIETLCKSWSSLRPEDLTPNWPSYPEQGTLDDLVTCPLGPVLAQVLPHMNAAHMLRSAEADLAQADMARRLEEKQRCNGLLFRARQSLNAIGRHLPADELEAQRARLRRIETQIKDKAET
ncbi:hypothetical protein [Halovulum sp. GXIMD14793]